MLTVYPSARTEWSTPGDYRVGLVAFSAALGNDF
jgi:hypothetical protein